MTPLQNTIIFLIGFSGVGKYTIAKEIASRTGSKLVDNHLINNPLFTVIEENGRLPPDVPIWDDTMRIRKLVLKTIRKLSPPHFSFVFTNVLFEGEPIDRILYRQIANLAKHRNAELIPVKVLCSAAELKKRRPTPERRLRLKETDISNIEGLLKHHELLKIRHPNLLTLDVSDITAEQSAEKILAHVRIRHAD